MIWRGSVYDYDAIEYEFEATHIYKVSKHTGLSLSVFSREYSSDRDTDIGAQVGVKVSF